MNTSNRIPADKWSFLRREVTSLQKATASGTPSFELLASLAGSRIYSCRYNQLGHLIESTYAVKDGRSIITEQNLQYYPAKVRFYYPQTPPANVFKQLEQLVLPHLKTHQSDLTRHIYNQIVTDNNSSPFIMCYTDSGADILQMMPTIEEITHPQWFQKEPGTDEEVRESLLKYHTGMLTTLVSQSKNFLHYNGYSFHPCPKEKITSIYHEHIQKLCANWKTSTLKFVKLPSRSLA